MKKLAAILLVLTIGACSTEIKQEEVVRELAKKDAIEKFQLPEGTAFNDENIEISQTQTGQAFVGVSYLVRITIKSQDGDGNPIVKTHTLNYNKTGDGGLSPQDYQLVDFE